MKIIDLYIGMSREDHTLPNAFRFKGRIFNKGLFGENYYDVTDYKKYPNKFLEDIFLWAGYRELNWPIEVLNEEYDLLREERKKLWT